MRQVISVSLPVQQATKVRKLAVQRGYQNVSKYINHLIEADADLITEEKLLQSVKRARSEYRKGTIIHAKSLDELL